MLRNINDLDKLDSLKDEIINKNKDIDNLADKLEISERKSRTQRNVFSLIVGAVALSGAYFHDTIIEAHRKIDNLDSKISDFDQEIQRQEQFIFETIKLSSSKIEHEIQRFSEDSENLIKKMELELSKLESSKNALEQKRADIVSSAETIENQMKLDSEKINRDISQVISNINLIESDIDNVIKEFYSTENANSETKNLKAEERINVIKSKIDNLDKKIIEYNEKLNKIFSIINSIEPLAINAVDGQKKYMLANFENPKVCRLGSVKNLREGPDRNSKRKKILEIGTLFIPIMNERPWVYSATEGSNFGYIHLRDFSEETC